MFCEISPKPSIHSRTIGPIRRARILARDLAKARNLAVVASFSGLYFEQQLAEEEATDVDEAMKRPRRR